MLLGWCGLVPWLAVLDRAATIWRALGSGLLMAEAFVLAVFFWFAQAIATYTGAPLAVGVLVLLVLAPILQPQFLAFAAARHLMRGRGAGIGRMAVTGACVYVGAEWASPKLFGDTIGHGLYASPLLRQTADLGGAHGLTFVLLLANACVAAAVSAVAAPHETAPRVRVWAAPLTGVAMLVVVLLAYGAWRYRDLDRGPGAAPVRAGIVQGDISHYEQLAARIGTYDAVALILDAYFALSDELLQHAAQRQLDLLVWPETVYPTTFGTPKSADGAEFDRAIAGFVDRTGVPLVFGSYDADGGDEFNAAVFLEPATDGGSSFQAYRKASLFPLTERVPALFELSAVRRWLPWLGTWKPGTGARVVSLRLRDGRTLRVAPLICYDAVDPRRAIAAVRDGAELIVTLSNDAWFAAGGGPRLHLVVSAFRSLETRRAQVRATNTGISAVITPTGELLGTIDVGARGTLAASVVPNPSTRTLMLAWGDWFGPAAFAVGVGLMAVTLLPHGVGTVRERGRPARAPGPTLFYCGRRSSRATRPGSNVRS